MTSSKLVLGDEVIWTNPEPIGYFGVKLRKQIREDEIADRMQAKRAALARTSQATEEKR